MFFSSSKLLISIFPVDLGLLKPCSINFKTTGAIFCRLCRKQFDIVH